MNLLRNLADFARMLGDEVLAWLQPAGVEVPVAPVVELHPPAPAPVEETHHG